MPESHAGAPTRFLLGPGTGFTGLVVLHDTAEIQGWIRGDVMGAERLRIGPCGRIEGQVEAAEVIVAGTLEGELRARRRAELEATARVRGVVRSPRLMVADGGILEGSCQTGDSLADTGAPTSESP